jgi:hypothetical protein
MKKRSLITIPILIVFIIVLAFVWLNHQQTPALQLTLIRYLIYLNKTVHHTCRALSISAATTPANFTPAMSAESYNGSVIFETTRPQSVDYSLSLEPIPYPPEQVMRVLSEVDNQPQLVYVALHNSLYNAGWIVHVSNDPWGSPALRSHMDALGCAIDA